MFLSFQTKLVVSLALIQAVYSIYELGILHYDIALRNLTFKENDDTGKWISFICHRF